MIDKNGLINLSKLPGHSRIVRTKSAINEVKQRVTTKRRVFERISAKELKMTETTVHRAYKLIHESALTEEQKKSKKICSLDQK